MRLCFQHIIEGKVVRHHQPIKIAAGVEHANKDCLGYTFCYSNTASMLKLFPVSLLTSPAVDLL